MSLRTGPAVVLITALFSCGPGSVHQQAAAYSEEVSLLFDPTLKPFYYGVASGDPLPDRVILWTRITPEFEVESIPVTWEVAESPDFKSIYKSDTARAKKSRNFTVKVDVDALIPDHVYYYRFSAAGINSITGRTKTAPIGGKDSLKFAVATCANWEWGHFNAYGRIADREILDGVLHLGDYIYEHATGVYGDTTIGRTHLPKHEVVNLSDYRTRYSQYHLDANLRRLHQQQVMIPIWDDHEIANNSYTQGAQNHQPEEGNYELRKAAARQAYYEWLPIRESGQLYRSYSFGKLVDLFMLDERLAGKTKPVDSIQDPQYYSELRSMLGTTQLNWLENQIKTSTATWKIIGNQVLFSDIDLTATRPRMPHDLDSWDGYPAEKRKVKGFIVNNKCENVLFVTGDTHSALAIEAATEVNKTYLPFAVELGTTSISSANGDEYQEVSMVKKAEDLLLKMNPHVKFFNNREHGYLLLSISSDRVKAEWFFVETLRKEDTREHLGKVFVVNKGNPRLK